MLCFLEWQGIPGSSCTSHDQSQNILEFMKYTYAIFSLFATITQKPAVSLPFFNDFRTSFIFFLLTLSMTFLGGLQHVIFMTPITFLSPSYFLFLVPITLIIHFRSSRATTLIFCAIQLLSFFKMLNNFKN